MKWRREIPKRKDVVIWSNFDLLFLYELYRYMRKGKKKRSSSISPVPTVCDLLIEWEGETKSQDRPPKWVRCGLTGLFCQDCSEKDLYLFGFFFATALFV